jgi:hypothetical protein
MYLLMAYAFVICTTLMILGLLWLWWLERRDVAQHEAALQSRQTEAGTAAAGRGS